MIIYVVLAIFLITYAILFFRKIGGRTLPIWASMVVGAFLMVVTGSISPIDAFHSIDFRVISFLFGMLVITAAFEKSGLIEYFVLAILRRAKNLNSLLLAVVFGSGLLSAILVNDTIALLVTPMVLSFGARLGLKKSRAFLIPLAFGITTGSAISPIGNPQNLLVALNSGMSAPFVWFLAYLLIPSLMSLMVVFLISKFLYRKDLRDPSSNYSQNHDPVSTSSPSAAISDWRLAKLTLATLGSLMLGFALVEIFPVLQSIGLSIDTLALIAGLVLLALSEKRTHLLVSMNWGILIFFAGMFVVMGAVWNSGIGAYILSAIPAPMLDNKAQSVASIMTSSIILSQILSNVPFVQLYSYQMHALGFTSTSVVQWLALAAGSTLAGNLTILGAVSNVIVMDSVENRVGGSFSFLEFLIAGIPVTIVTVLIFYAFLVLI